MAADHVSWDLSVPDQPPQLWDSAARVHFCVSHNILECSCRTPGQNAHTKDAVFPHLGHRYTYILGKGRGGCAVFCCWLFYLLIQMAVGEGFKSKVGRVVADLWHQSRQFRLCHMRSENQCVPTSKGQKTTLHVRPSFISDDLRLRVSRVSQKPACKTVFRTKHSMQRGVCFLKKPGGIGAAHYSSKRISRSQQQSKVDTIWTKPVFEFLSMALPVEQWSYPFVFVLVHQFWLVCKGKWEQWKSGFSFLMVAVCVGSYHGLFSISMNSLKIVEKSYSYIWAPPAYSVHKMPSWLYFTLYKGNLLLAAVLEKNLLESFPIVR